jgi:hypothetical protein
VYAEHIPVIDYLDIFLQVFICFYFNTGHRVLQRIYIDGSAYVNTVELARVTCFGFYMAIAVNTPGKHMFAGAEYNNSK